MQLTDKHIAKFQSLYKERYGKEISAEDAREQGTKLLRLMQLTYKPMTPEEFARVQARQAELTQTITKQ